MTIVEREQWDEFLLNYQDASFYQTGPWGELKEQFGWDKPICVVSGSAGAQIFIKKLPFGIRFAYIPKGPLGTDWQELWREIDEICQSMGVAFLKVEPDINEPVGESFYQMMDGFFLSDNYIQPYNSMYIDLNGTEKEWLARITRNNRQYIRRAKENGLYICESNDIESLYHLIQVTSNRHDFVSRSLEYYQAAFETFVSRGKGALLMVMHEEKPLSAFLLYGNGSRIWAVHGGSIEDKNELFPNYLLYWETMRWSAAHGYKTLDMQGIANESRIEDVDDPMKSMGGIYNFKRRFGAQLVRSVGAWDKVYQPAKYQIYRLANRAMDVFDSPLVEKTVMKVINLVKK